MQAKRTWAEELTFMKSNIQRDALASVVVFLVALPLCMGIAIASGVPPARGLITGIVGGIIVGFISGSPLQVSGPAAGLAVMILNIVNEYGLATMGYIVLAAGMLQAIAGYLGFARWFRAVSPAVIQGMLAGIGVLIFASQFHVMVDDAPRGSGLENLRSIPEAIIKGVFPIDGSVHHLAAGIGILTILTIVIWNLFRPQSLKMIPGPLLAVVLASAAANLFALPIQFVEVPANLLNAVSLPQLNVAMSLLSPGFFGTVLGVAVIASAESLLCATAVDKLHDGRRTNYNQEMMAQGLGNMICGFLGALPMTGVIVRSSANVQAGAKTRSSAILHGIWILLLVAAFPQVLSMVPRAALAGILVYTGYKLVNPIVAKSLWASGRIEFGIYVATIVTIVSTDLLTGVVVGFVLAIARLLYKLTHMDLEITGDSPVHVTIYGAATFISLPKLAETLEAISQEEEVHIHIGGVAFIDHAALEFLEKWQETHPETVHLEWDALHTRAKSLAFSSKDGGEKQSSPRKLLSRTH